MEREGEDMHGHKAKAESVVMKPNGSHGHTDM